MERVLPLASGYTVAAYARKLPGGRGYHAYAKVFRERAASYWDGLAALAKFSGLHSHATPSAAVEDALDTAFMSLVNEGLVRSDWAPLDSLATA